MSTLLYQVCQDVATRIAAGTFTDCYGTSIPAVVDWPPQWDSFGTAAILVRPEADAAEPTLTGCNDLSMGIAVTICEQTEGTADLSSQLNLRTGIRSLFLGKRLSGTLSDVYCERVEESPVYDEARVVDYQFVSGLMLRFKARENR
jgi:hypothetical protein